MVEKPTLAGKTFKMAGKAVKWREKQKNGGKTVKWLEKQ